MNDVGLELPDALASRADALRGRGAADRARVGAGRVADRHALRPRRADDRAPRGGHAAAARASSAASRTAATPWSSSSTTRRSSRPRTTSSTSGPARAAREGGSSSGRAAVARAGEGLRDGRAPAPRRARGDASLQRAAGAGAGFAPGRPVPPRRGLGHDRRRAGAQPQEPDRADSRSAGSSPSPAFLARASPRSCATSCTTRTLGASKGTAAFDLGAHDRIEGFDSISDLLLVDQSPLGRSARSNPVTYTKAWDEVRTLFARSARAVAKGVSARRLLVQRSGRAVRGMPRHRLADDRHAVPRRRDGALRRLRRAEVPVARPLGARARQEHRRRPRHDDRPGDRVLLLRGEDRPPSRAAPRGGPRVHAARSADRDPLGRRGAAAEAGGVSRDPPGRVARRALPVRRADDRPARERRRATPRHPPSPRSRAGTPSSPSSTTSSSSIPPTG